MSRLSTKRAANIDADFTAIEKSYAKIASDLKRETDILMQHTGWMHDNIIGEKGDIDVLDRADFNATFEPVFSSIQAELSKMAECYAVYDDNPTVYAQNLADFIAKYPLSAPDLVEQRFS